MSYQCVPLYDTLGENAVEYILTHSEVGGSWRLAPPTAAAWQSSTRTALSAVSALTKPTQGLLPHLQSVAAKGDLLASAAHGLCVALQTHQYELGHPNGEVISAHLHPTAGMQPCSTTG